MIKKLMAVRTLLKKGEAVADPGKWKSRQITATALTGALWAAVQAAEVFGYALPIDEATVDGVAVGVLAIVNWMLTLSTSKTIGV